MVFHVSTKAASMARLGHSILSSYYRKCLPSVSRLDPSIALPWTSLLSCTCNFDVHVFFLCFVGLLQIWNTRTFDMQSAVRATTNSQKQCRNKATKQTRKNDGWTGENSLGSGRTMATRRSPARNELCFVSTWGFFLASMLAHFYLFNCVGINKSVPLRNWHSLSS